MHNPTVESLSNGEARRGLVSSSLFSLGFVGVQMRCAAFFSFLVLLTGCRDNQPPIAYPHFHEKLPAPVGVFDDYDFNEGGYSLVARYASDSWSALRFGMVEFILDDVDALNELKKDWVFDTDNSGWASGYHYKIALMKDGKEIDDYWLNLEHGCNAIHTNKGTFLFDQTKFFHLKKKARPIVRIDKKFTNRKEGLETIKEIEAKGQIVYSSANPFVDSPVRSEYKWSCWIEASQKSQAFKAPVEGAYLNFTVPEGWVAIDDYDKGPWAFATFFESIVFDVKPYSKNYPMDSDCTILRENKKYRKVLRSDEQEISQNSLTGRVIVSEVFDINRRKEMRRNYCIERKNSIFYIRHVVGIDELPGAHSVEDILGLFHFN